MILGTISYPFGQAYAIRRTRLIAFAVEWWSPVILITPGNPSVFQEVPFGGYRMHIKYYDWVYAWSTKTCQVDEVIEEAWAYAPGSGTPISFGNANFFVEWNTTIRAYCFVFSLVPNNGARCYQEFPPYTIPPWNAPVPVPHDYPYFVP